MPQFFVFYALPPQAGVTGGKHPNDLVTLAHAPHHLVCAELA
jgi:hypothetical protein